MDNEVTKVVDHLAEKLSVPAAHLWGILVKQAPVIAVGSISEALIWLTLTALVSFLTYAALKKSDTDDSCTPFGILGIFLSLIGIVISAVMIHSAAITYTTYVCNPEYLALKQIVDVLQSAK